MRIGESWTEVITFELGGGDPETQNVPAVIGLEQYGQVARAIGVSVGQLPSVRIGH